MLGRMAAEIGCPLKVIVAILKLILWRIWKPMQIRKNRCDATEPRFLGDQSSKSILDKLKASQI